LECERLLELRLDPLFARDSRDRRLDDALELANLLPGGRTDVDREVGESRDDVRPTGCDRELADVRGHALSCPGEVAELERDPSRGDQGISPPKARLPKSAALNRVPSSSMKATTQSGRSGSKPSSCRSRTACTAATTPSAPSSRPPAGTVSRCEPTSRGLPLPVCQRPKRLPAASISASSPSARIRSAAQE